MRASEVVEVLQELIKQHGDLEVAVPRGEEGYSPEREISCVIDFYKNRDVYKDTGKKYNEEVLDTFFFIR